MSPAQWVASPLISAEEHRALQRLQVEAPALTDHFWIQSSGSSRRTQDSAKWVALSKSAFLSSALAVNQVLGASSAHRWGLLLPEYHVGGLSIYARAFLSEATVVVYAGPWNPKLAHQWMTREKITHSSLVPTQLFDLVEAGLSSPPYLECVFLGGADTDFSLWQKALALGWPLRLTFGMTETCSQIACSDLGQRELRILGHVQLKTNREQRLLIQSSALMTGFVQVIDQDVRWIKISLEDGFWLSSDHGQIQEDILLPLGRSTDFVKIKGEGVSLAWLRQEFSVFLQRRNQSVSRLAWEIISVPQPRDGATLVLVSGMGLDLSNEIQNWNQSCFPLHRLILCTVSEIPRGILGKTQWETLASLVQSKVKI